MNILSLFVLKEHLLYNTLFHSNVYSDYTKYRMLQLLLTYHITQSVTQSLRKSQPDTETLKVWLSFMTRKDVWKALYNSLNLHSYVLHLLGMKWFIHVLF